MQRIKQRLEDKLNAAFAPSALTVTDDSALHSGHAGAREGGESHFTIALTAEAFSGKTRVERHRLINTALKDELAGPVHALVIKAKAPGE